MVLLHVVQQIGFKLLHFIDWDIVQVTVDAGVNRQLFFVRPQLRTTVQFVAAGCPLISSTDCHATMNCAM